MFLRTTQHLLHRDAAQATVLRIAPPRDVEQRQDAVKQPPVLGPVVAGLLLLEDLPGELAILVVLDVVGCPPDRVRQRFERGLHLGEPIHAAGLAVVGVISLCQRAVDALDHLGARVRAELKGFVVVDECGIAHRGPFYLCRRRPDPLNPALP
jgi:hypothetical protein